MRPDGNNGKHTNNGKHDSDTSHASHHSHRSHASASLRLLPDLRLRPDRQYDRPLPGVTMVGSAHPTDPLPVTPRSSEVPLQFVRVAYTQACRMLV